MENEAAFQINGTVATRNLRCYAPKHYSSVEHAFSKSMSREKLSVWIGLCGNEDLVGPFFFENKLNGKAYFQILNNQIVPGLVELYVLQKNGTFLRVWCAQDGAPGHRRIMMIEHFQELFLDHIISPGCHHEWPSRSPDPTPFAYFVWGYLKSKVFLTPPANLADLRQRITMEAVQIPQDMIIRATHEMRKRAELCIRNDGGHIEGRFGLQAD